MRALKRLSNISKHGLGAQACARKQAVFASGSIDAVYTNALDHVLSLEERVGEVQRLLRPHGVFVADLELGSAEGFIPGEYEAATWRDHEPLTDRIEDLALRGRAGARSRQDPLGPIDAGGPSPAA